MRIAVDAFGSDHCPVPDVEGAVLAAREWGDEIILVGPEGLIQAELAKHNIKGLKIRVQHAPEIITMEDHSDAVRAKENSSVRVGMRMVKSGEADAFVSVGNTIALLSAAIFDLRRIRGIRRPALATIYPVAVKPVLMLDLGATADPKPEYLLQFAKMGIVYAERVMGIPNPKVGLLANGEEAGKGTMTLRDTYYLFDTAGFNFVGNVEPKEVTRGVADVVVTDGFTGNIMAKTTEAVAAFFARTLKHKLFDPPAAKLGWLVMLPGLLLALPGLIFFTPALRSIAKRMDYAEIGGAPLLGVDGVVIGGHGRSNAKAIKNAINQARRAVQQELLPTIKAGLQETPH